MKTIAQLINWDFEANGNLEIKDKKGDLIYHEFSNGFWEKSEYDSQGNVIYFENSDGFWEKTEYNYKGNKIYYEISDGFWTKWEYDSEGNEIYYEDSDDQIVDNRHKPSENKVIEIDGVKYKLIEL